MLSPCPVASPPVTVTSGLSTTAAKWVWLLTVLLYPPYLLTVLLYIPALKRAVSNCNGNDSFPPSPTCSSPLLGPVSRVGVLSVEPRDTWEGSWGLAVVSRVGEPVGVCAALLPTPGVGGATVGEVVADVAGVPCTADLLPASGRSAERRLWRAC